MVFRMNGKRISNDLLFRQHFAPADLLRQREAAAGLAVQVLGKNAYIRQYHAEMIYRCVFQDIPGPEEERERARPNWSWYWMGGFYGGDREKEQANGLLKELWRLLYEGRYPSEEELPLFFLLAAGYLLAGKTLEEIPLTRQEAKAAYERTPTEKETLAFPSLPASGDVILEARKEPYQLILDTGRQLGEEVITTRKLTAVHHWQGDPTVQVTLEVYRGVELLTTETIPVGDYRVCSFVGNTPVWLHPGCVRNGEAVMTRQGNDLILTHPDKGKTVIDCTGQTILSFAPEEDGEHWVAAAEGRLMYGSYSMRWTHGRLLRRARDITELTLWPGGVLLLLNRRGEVLSTSVDHRSLQGKRWTCLQQVSEGGGEP